MCVCVCVCVCVHILIFISDFVIFGTLFHGISLQFFTFTKSFVHKPNFISM